VIIFGAAGGAMILSSGKRVISVLLHILDIFKGSKANRKAYVELLLLLNHIFSKAQREGLISLESHLDAPEKSDVFAKYPAILSNKPLMDFVTDNMRLIITASMSAHDLDNLIEIDIEAQHKEEMFAPNLINRIADSMPGLGIVAAVMGVVLTMGKITEPPEVLGHSIGAALVGTFMGVLGCYGFVGPIAMNLENQAKENEVFLLIIKMALIAFSEGSHPLLAVEAGRRAIPTKMRPTFLEIDQEIRKWKEKK
jgi:chemotaxis protein MotA